MVQIVESPVQDLESYARVPMKVHVSSRLDLTALSKNEFIEIPVAPWIKDYDSVEPIIHLRARFNTEHWRMMKAFAGEELVGGAVIAWNTPELDMLESRNDLSVLWDIRVSPDFQRQGVGRALFAAAAHWSGEMGCIEMRVETQDVNVSACRFYRAMGCKLHSIETNAYPELDEAKLLWSLDLTY